MVISQKILVVEDDDSLRPALERLLTAADFQVTAYASAEALLADADAGDVACVVCDLKLPAMSGFDLLVGWHGRGGRPPLILMTAYDTPGLGEEAARRGAAAYLAKPFRGTALLEAIDAAITSARPR
ncbi:MAG: response regulator [Candidatus Contendobacter sp.]|nr:response regulator [Candidatus Contendobacter sp.]MDG4557012.1 response regulator [Candidatus Contendobacter sp.]